MVQIILCLIICYLKYVLSEKYELCLHQFPIYGVRGILVYFSSAAGML